MRNPATTTPGRIGTAAMTLLLGAGAPAGPGLEAQELPRPPEARRGWVGFSYAIQIRGGEEYAGEDTPTVVRVTRVVDGSPAARGDLRPGDRILAVNGTAATPGAFRELSRDLRPGERVMLTVRRAGDPGTRTLEIRAGARPRAVPPPLPREVGIHLDSVREAVLAQFDSVRVRLGSSADQRVRVTFRGDSAYALRIGPDGEETTVVRPGQAPPLRGGETRVGAPRPPSDGGFRPLPLPPNPTLTDTTRLELRGLQEALVRTKLTESALRSRLQRRRARGAAPDPDELDRLRALESRVDSVNRALRTLYRRLARQQADVLRAWRERRREGAPLSSPGAFDQGPEPPRSPATAAPSPLSPHLVGRSYAAGARLATLNPGLAEYFDIDEGVLITEVVDGSPAEESGLRSGDVVVAVGDDAVGSVADLRRRLARARSWPVAMTVVRKDERRTIRLRR